MSLNVRQALACATTTVVLASVGVAQSAHAGSYEQISRGNDATGWSPFFANQQSVAASDSGRYGIFSQTSQSGATSFSMRFYLRDIVTNQSHQIGSDKLVRIYGIDKSETKALGLELLGATQRIVLLSAVGMPSKTIATFPASSVVYAALSGDGKTVVYSTDPTGLRKVNVASGAVTQLSTSYSLIGPRSVSDDGRVVTGETSPGGFVYVNSVRTDLPSAGIVSPDGSTVAYGPAYDDPTPKLSVRKVTTGVTTTYTYPSGSLGGRAVWISPDGSKYAAQLSDSDGNTSVQQLDLTTGAWAPFGGAYARSLTPQLDTEWDTANNQISRNGRYAVLGYSPLTPTTVHQSALVNLSGGDLPGAQEPLSASSYVLALPPTRSCATPEPSTLTLKLTQPASWIPKPRRASVTVTLYNGGGTSTKTFTTADAWDEFGEGQTVAVPANVAKYTLRASVIDSDGRYTHTAETKTIYCNPFG